MDSSRTNLTKEEIIQEKIRHIDSRCYLDTKDVNLDDKYVIMTKEELDDMIEESVRDRIRNINELNKMIIIFEDKVFLMILLLTIINFILWLLS